MKTFAVLLMVGLATTQCSHHGSLNGASNGEACGVLTATLYRGGSFKFSDAEIAAMTRENQVKLAAIKDFYKKQCRK